MKRPVHGDPCGDWNRTTTTATSARYVNSRPDVISMAACQRGRNSRPRWTSYYADFTSDKLCKSCTEKLEIQPCKFDSRRKFAAAFARPVVPQYTSTISNYASVRPVAYNGRAIANPRFFYPTRSILDLPRCPSKGKSKGDPRGRKAFSTRGDG